MLNGERHGFGCYVFKSGKYYEGEWSRDLVSGYGGLIYENHD